MYQTRKVDTKFFLVNTSLVSKEKFDRYVWLIELINRHGYIKYEDISRAWAFSPLNSAGSASIQQSELPPRTFYNHIEAIRSLDNLNTELCR